MKQIVKNSYKSDRTFSFVTISYFIYLLYNNYIYLFDSITCISIYIESFRGFRYDIFIPQFLLMITYLCLALKRMYIYKYKPYRELVTIIFLFFVYMVLQSVILGDYQGLIGVNRYLLYFSFLLLIVIYGNQNNVILIFRLASILFVLMIILYLLQFIRTGLPLGFRITRPQVLFGNANEDGGVLSVVFPLFIYHFRKQRNIIFFFTIIILPIVVFLNGTRASIFSIMLTIIVLILIFVRINILRMFLLFVLPFLVYYLSVKILTPEDIHTIKNMRDLQSLGINQLRGNLASRIGGIWILAFEYIVKTSPLIGFGNSSWDNIVENANIYYMSAGRRIYERSPHNFFIVWLGNFGFIGMVFLFVFFKQYFFTKIRITINNRSDEFMFITFGMVCPLISFFIWGMFANAYSIDGWIILTMLMGISGIYKYKNNHER